ncbi:LysE family translocator [Microbulbifer yueqingensis]|uniref:Threonine/homoserine/homoserine lactone efflux protein n=1 Tax=Microbulbifer yueqingensis TaxID=658219 RepID=A0A1G9AIF7_9GAMM|nr:LysE family translocator [Microbulbifer yueqingensis]SDK27139.1 Threonine/homoserine/homoserine lactone efflux protein [Microbulbifer yueqingensis]
MIEALLPLALFVFSTSITPGPNNMMIMASGVNHGIARSLPHFLGICIGFPAMIMAIGLGLGTVFAEFPLLYQVVRWAGIVYLLYLAWAIATTRDVDRAERHRPFTFLQAAAFQWVNPKGWVMAVGALAAFSTPGVEPWVDASRVALAFVLVGGPCIVIWLLFGVGMQRLLTNARYLRLFNITMGTLLAASIVPMVLE